MLLTAAGDSLWRRWIPHPVTVPISVRIEALPIRVPEVAVISVSAPDHVPSAAPRSPARAQQPPQLHAPIVEARPVPEDPLPLLAPDPHYYSARDLDSYPWPLVPLQLGALAGARGGEVRLELLIDEFGVVREIVFAERARHDQADAGLRALLAATPFVPARKDGRAVRSRVTLRLDLAHADGGR
jgi:protein TonB